MNEPVEFTDDTEVKPPADWGYFCFAASVGALAAFIWAVNIASLFGK